MGGNTSARRKVWEDPNGLKYSMDLLLPKIVWSSSFVICEEPSWQKHCGNGIVGEGMIFTRKKFHWNFPVTNHLKLDVICVNFKPLLYFLQILKVASKFHECHEQASLLV